MSNTRIVVVGGGIGGLAAALALTLAGHDVTVLERSPGFTEIGAGIQLAPNATRVLDKFGVLGPLLDVAVQPRRLVLADALTAEELTSLDVTDFRKRYGGPYIVAHRSDVLKLLLAACMRTGVELRTSTEVQRVIDGGAEVTVVCADGWSLNAAVALGADGLRSRVRTEFVRDEPIASGYVAYRGAVPMDQVARHADLRDVVGWIGPGLHLVQYPLRSGSLYNQVAVFRSDAFECGAQEWGTPEELDRTFSVCCAHVRESVPALGRDHRWPMFDRLPTSNWTRGRVALLGDAAHPMLQYLAQGACQSIEDAATIEKMLQGRDLTSTEQVTAALASYRDERAPHTAQVQATARVWGDFWHVEGDEAIARNKLLLTRDVDSYSQIDWLYGVR